MLRDDEFTYEEHYAFNRSMEDYRQYQKKQVTATVFNLPDGNYQITSVNLSSINGQASLRLERVD